MNTKELEAWLHKKIVKIPSRSKEVSRYTGAQGHEDRHPDEMSKLIFWGSDLAQKRALLKELPAQFFSLSKEKQWSSALGLWKKSKIYDVRSFLFDVISQKSFRELRHKKASDLFDLADKIDNWALSDSLSSLLAEILEYDFRHFSVFEKWNNSNNAWLRRQSIVGIYHYASMRKKIFPAKKSIVLVEKLLDDKHFYVQRGVGWVLREIDRIDPELQRAFVKKHVLRISSTAWYASSELYAESERKKLVLERKKSRKA